MENTQQRYTNIITDYLRSHPLISSHALEKALNIPQSTLYKAVSAGRLIPIKHIFPLICELSKYGLEIDGYNLWLDEDTYTIFARKDRETVETKEVNNNFEYTVIQDRWMADSYFDLL